MTWGVDVSFEHSTVSYHDLARRGAAFVLGYVSDDPRKNLTAADKRAIEAAGMVALLFFEDTETDMETGAAGGYEHGATARIEAEQIGYDLARMPIFASNDRNAGITDQATILAYMESFAHQVPVAGYYGDQDSIDFLAARHPEWWFVQSDSSSYGNGISRHAHLLQRYNDPRVAGLPVDVDDVQIDGIPWLGDDMYTDTDRARDARMAAQLDKISYTEGLTLPAIAEIRGNAQNTARAVLALHTAEDPAALAAELAPLLHEVPAAELQAALAQVLAQVKLSVPGQ